MDFQKSAISGFGKAEDIRVEKSAFLENKGNLAQSTTSIFYKYAGLQAQAVLRRINIRVNVKVG